MSDAETIGVDLGGTKAQIGVQAGVETLLESREASTEQTQDELVDLLVREINAAHEARPAATAVGLGRRRWTMSAASRSPPSTCRLSTCRSAT